MSVPRRNPEIGGRKEVEKGGGKERRREEEEEKEEKGRRGRLEKLERKIRVLEGVGEESTVRPLVQKSRRVGTVSRFCTRSPRRCQPAGALFQDRTESGTTIALISTRMPCRRPPWPNSPPPLRFPPPPPPLSLYTLYQQPDHLYPRVRDLPCLLLPSSSPPPLLTFFFFINSCVGHCAVVLFLSRLVVPFFLQHRPRNNSHSPDCVTI